MAALLSVEVMSVLSSVVAELYYLVVLLPCLEGVDKLDHGALLVNQRVITI